MNLFLASNSPRRKQLLIELGYDFQQLKIDFDEEVPRNVLPENVSKVIVEQKVNQVRKIEISDSLIIVADTVVFYGDSVLGKPENEEDAKNMLVLLSGKKHTVSSSFALISQEKYEVFSDFTTVVFKNFEKKEIEYYIRSFSPFDKAGGYGIQEWIGFIGVEKIMGSYNTVMGLPTHLLYDALKKYAVFPRAY